MFVAEVCLWLKSRTLLENIVMKCPLKCRLVQNTPTLSGILRRNRSAYNNHNIGCLPFHPWRRLVYKINFQTLPYQNRQRNQLQIPVGNLRKCCYNTQFNLGFKVCCHLSISPITLLMSVIQGTFQFTVWWWEPFGCAPYNLDAFNRTTNKTTCLFYTKGHWWRQRERNVTSMWIHCLILTVCFVVHFNCVMICLLLTIL